MPTALPKWVVRVALAGSVLLFWPGLVEQFEVPKAWLVRVLGLGIGAALVASAALDRSSQRRPRLVVAGEPAARWALSPARAIDLAVALWLVIELITTATSVSPRISVLGEVLQREGLLTSLGLAGLYAAARVGHRSPRDFEVTFAWLAVPTALSCVYALLQAARMDPVKWGQMATYGTLVRPFGTLGHPNLLGIITGIATVWSVTRAVEFAERRWIYLPAALLFGGATVLTFSRGAWLGALAGVAVAIVMALRLGRHLAITRREVVVGAGVVALIVAMFVAGGWGHLFGARAAEFQSASTGSAGSRMEIWRTAIAAWRALPLLGHGPDTFELVFPQFQTAAYWGLEWLGLPCHAHSIYLHTLATRGLLGLFAGLVWAGAIAWALRGVRREHDDAAALAPALCGMLIVLAGAGGFGALGIAGALLGAIATAGVASVVDGEGARVGSGLGAAVRASSSRRAGRWALVVGVAVAGVTMFGASREFAAAGAVVEAKRHIHAGDAVGALAALENVRLDPFEDNFERASAEVYLSLPPASPQAAEAGPGAVRAARRAIALTPARELAHARLAEGLGVQALHGDSAAIDAMESAYARAFALAPHDVVLRAENARYDILLGRFAEALVRANAAAQLDSTMAEAHLLRAEALSALGQRDAARAALERALNANWHGVEGREQVALRLAAALGLEAVVRP